MSNENKDKSTWAIGGGVLIGLGVGFFLLPISAVYFVGALILGLGCGIVVSSIISRKK